MPIYFNPACKAYEDYQHLITDCQTQIQASTRKLHPPRIYTPPKSEEDLFSLVDSHRLLKHNTASKIATLVFENFKDLIDVPHSSQYELGPFLSALQRMNNYAAWNEKKSFDNQFLKLTVLVQEHLLEPDLKNA